MAENRELALVLKLVADQFQKELRNSQGALGGFNRFIQDWRVHLTAAGAALFAIAKSTATYGEELLKASQKTGISVEAMAGLRFAANQADLNLAQLETGLKSLSQNMVEAAKGTGDGQQAFARLGLTATDMTGQLRPVDQVLLEIAEAFANSADGAGKADLAVKLFGQAGLELMPVLNQGKTGIQALQEEAKRLGIVMSEGDVRAAATFNDELKSLTASVSGLRNRIGVELIPTLTELVKVLTDLASGPVGTGLSAMLEGFAKHMIGLNALIKQFRANWNFAFGDLTLEGLRAEIAKTEAEARQRLFLLEHPGAKGLLEPSAPTPGPATAKAEIPLGQDRAAQDKLLEDQKKSREKALKEEFELVKIGLDRLRIQYDTDLAQGVISLEQNVQAKTNVREKEFDEEGALLIRLKEATVQFYQERVALGFKNKDERVAIETTFKDELAAMDQQIVKNAAERNKALDQATLDSLNARLTAEREHLALVFAGSASMKADRERQAEDWVQFYQRLLTAAEQSNAGIEELAAAREDVLLAQMAKELELTESQVRRLIQARLAGEAELAAELFEKAKGTELQKEGLLIEGTARFLREQRLQADGFVAGWQEGFARYLRDIESTFGLAQDMARRTAQAMEGAFRNFFFDLFENRIRTLEDLLKGFAGFVKQIAAQIAAQMAIMAIFRALGMGGGFSLFSINIGQGGGGEPVNIPGGFQKGGRFTVPGLGGPDSRLLQFMATPGERVTIETPAQVAGAGRSLGDGGPPIINVAIHNPGRTDRPQVSVRQVMREVFIDVLYTELRTNGDFRKMLAGGLG